MAGKSGSGRLSLQSLVFINVFIVFLNCFLELISETLQVPVTIGYGIVNSPAKCHEMSQGEQVGQDNG
jgi:hypothetical protein